MKPHPRRPQMGLIGTVTARMPRTTQLLTGLDTLKSKRGTVCPTVQRARLMTNHSTPLPHNAPGGPNSFKTGTNT